MRKIIIILSILIAAPSLALAADCPFGLTNDPAPGSCNLYRDNNSNNICDLSESGEPSPANAQESTGAEAKRPDYNFGTITLIISLAYLLSLLAVSKKKITALENRRFWNWLLLVLFVPTALTSLLLVMAVEYGPVIDLGLNISYWHYIFGWAFLLVSLFHLLWHLAYYFRKNKHYEQCL